MGKVLIIKGADFSRYAIGKVQTGGGSSSGGTSGGGSSAGGASASAGAVRLYKGYLYPCLQSEAAAALILPRNVFAVTQYSSAAANINSYLVATPSADISQTFEMMSLATERTITIPAGYTYTLSIYDECTDGYTATGVMTRSNGIIATQTTTIKVSEIRSIIKSNNSETDNTWVPGISAAYSDSRNYKYWGIYLMPSGGACTPEEAANAGFKIV